MKNIWLLIALIALSISALAQRTTQQLNTPDWITSTTVENPFPSYFAIFNMSKRPTPKRIPIYDDGSLVAKIGKGEWAKVQCFSGQHRLYPQKDSLRRPEVSLPCSPGTTLYLALDYKSWLRGQAPEWGIRSISPDEYAHMKDVIKGKKLVVLLDGAKED